MKYYVIAGEASGDLHGARLIRAIQQNDADAIFRVWGGDNMAQTGAQTVKHIRDLAFMGFVEVVKHLPTILKNIQFCKEDIDTFQPDALILIDYPGFNLRIAEWAKKQGFKVIYYISPQVWAWKEGRVKLIKQYVDLMLVILPFEVDFYKTWDYPVHYVGHPLVENIAEYKALHPSEKSKSIALLPGSRLMEVKKHLPIMLKAVEPFQKDYQIEIAQSPTLDDSVYKELINNYNVTLTNEGAYKLLNKSTAALVTSGTATLETALFGVPQLVCYKGNPISYYIARALIKVKYISLVNLIADKPVVPELIQKEFKPELIQEKLAPLLDEQSNERKDMICAYHSLWTLLGSSEASEKASQIILKFLA